MQSGLCAPGRPKKAQYGSLGGAFVTEGAVVAIIGPVIIDVPRLIRRAPIKPRFEAQSERMPTCAPKYIQRRQASSRWSTCKSPESHGDPNGPSGSRKPSQNNPHTRCNQNLGQLNLGHSPSAIGAQAEPGHKSQSTKDSSGPWPSADPEFILIFHQPYHNSSFLVSLRHGKLPSAVWSSFIPARPLSSCPQESAGLEHILWCLSKLPLFAGAPGYWFDNLSKRFFNSVS